jgi:hypothetical protein
VKSTSDATEEQPPDETSAGNRTNV